MELAIAKERHIITTADGSSSIYIPELREGYHSKFGSIAESEHIYIENGLKVICARQNTIKLFEMGLGTGLNALLSYIFIEESKCKIDYSCIEKYPLDKEEAKALNFIQKLRRTDIQDVFMQIHAAKWNNETKLSDNFNLVKIKGDIQDIELSSGFDLVYFDAFAPEVQPNLWTKEIFAKIHKSMAKDAILMTYCVKGRVRNTLKELGFEIVKMKGPINGKREILKAIKV